jgi:hypothetical protein
MPVRTCSLPEGGGAVNLTVAGKPVVEQYSKPGPNAGTVELAAGDQPFEICTTSREPWYNPALGLYAEAQPCAANPCTC